MNLKRLLKKIKNGEPLNMKDKAVIRIVSITALTVVICVLVLQNGFDNYLVELIILAIAYLGGMKISDILPDILEKDEKEQEDEIIKELNNRGKNK